MANYKIKDGVKLKYYDELSGPKVDNFQLFERPSLIIKHYIRRQSKRHGLTEERARHEMSRRTGIIVDDIKEFEKGKIPTSLQIQQLIDGLCWSLFWIFGISESAYLKDEQVFFDEIGNSQPSPQERKAFAEFYEEFLEMITREERIEDNEL